MTGTEPRQPDLRQEPYWPALTDVLDWAERNTVSTILSCLAAHAGVLHSDGILRQPLDDKQFGVFESSKVCDARTNPARPRSLRFPHSRWNEVRESSLSACGYSVLTKSALAGVDLFAMRKKKSLFVHFQGHPEYGTRTLLKEYRRDIKRFLRQERETYPTTPHGYFDDAAAELLAEFKEAALAHPREEQLAFFPEDDCWRCFAEHLAILGYEHLYELVAVCVVEKSGGIAIRVDDRVLSGSSAKTVRRKIATRARFTPDHKK